MVKNEDDMLSCFHLILERNRRTDRRTDRFARSILRISIQMRNKNGPFELFTCTVPTVVLLLTTQFTY